MASLFLCKFLFFVMMWFLEGGVTANDWAVAYSMCFCWFCPIIDVVFYLLLVSYLECNGFLVNNYRLWTSG